MRNERVITTISLPESVPLEKGNADSGNEIAKYLANASQQTLSCNDTSSHSQNSIHGFFIKFKKYPFLTRQ